MALPTVLAVDDERAILLALVRTLSREFAVTTASSADEAEQFLAAFSFDLVVSDFQMPHRNGIELLQRAREIQASSKRVLLTAGLPPSVTGLSVCDAILEKPWVNAELRAALVEVVRRP